MHVSGTYSEYVLIKNDKNEKSTAKILSVLQDLTWPSKAVSMR